MNTANVYEHTQATAPYLTTEQVAAVLQVEQRTVAQWLRTGQLKGVKMGRLWRVPPSALDEFLNSTD